MDPRHNVQLATFLYGPPAGPPPEASFRGACGRAYYSAFALARDALASAGHNLPRSQVHDVVISRLKGAQDQNVRAAGGELQQLRRDRNRADYDVGLRTKQSFGQLHAKIAVARAHKVIAVVDQAQQQGTLPPPPP